MAANEYRETRVEGSRGFWLVLEIQVSYFREGVIGQYHTWQVISTQYFRHAHTDNS